jgi:alpha-mannosidase
MGGMRITGVESTDLFQGSAGRPLQVIRVTVEPTGSDGEGRPATLRIEGAAAETPLPFGMTVPAPGESRSCEVAVAVTGAPGTELPVTVIAETAAGRTEHAARITAAEPGWMMWMVSHFHYDPVWWSTQGQFTEARLVLPDEDGELPDTRTAFDLVRLHLEKARRDPDYKFVLAEIDYLKPHFDAFPRDRAFVRELLAEGRLELVGGTYNEPNTNLTSAETTIRNAVYGMGFQRDVLGADPRSAWMLDAFGHDPGFPSLMASAGLTSSSWARGPFHQWGPNDNTRMQFPADFEWVSPDGSGLLTAYMANHYGAGWTLHTPPDREAALQAAYREFRMLASVAATRNVMLPVGSDHNIPARWVTDVHREWNKRYLWPRFVTAIPREFFDAVRADASGASGAAGAEPGGSGGRFWIMPQTRDMNPVYTGKDVSYADTKQAQRAGETVLGEAERLATLAWLRGAPYPAESLDKAWRQLAYAGHHDAITGTESDQVYLDLLAGWREAWQRGDRARSDAIDFLTGAGSVAGFGAGGGGAVTVVNGLARERDATATVTVRPGEPGTGWLELRDPDSGAAVPALAEGVRRHGDGSLAEVTLTFRARGVPALGFRRYPLVAVPAGPITESPIAESPIAESPIAESTAAAGWTDVEGTTIENEFLAVTADPARGGTLRSVLDKRSGREVLRGPGNELVLQEEYDKHPSWGEGPWHLSPKGPGTGSAGAEATVRAQRCGAGSRLVSTFPLGDLTITAETLLWDGADRVEFRTRVAGSIGKDRMLRVRFPAAMAGGLPVYQTATAVIGRPFGAPEADTATHPWTLDNPANQWFGIGSVARAVLATPGGEVPVGLGVAEVVTPEDIQNGDRRLIRDLIVALGRAGVTATCSRANGPRYGSVDVDSNLPDFRIALGGPSENGFTAEVLAACDPPVAKQLAALAGDGTGARLWVPAARSRASAFEPSADLRGPRDLPVLIVAPGGPAELEKALSELLAGLRDRVLRATAADGAGLSEPPLADGTVALFNRGTPSGVVTPDGTLWMTLLRACSSWPSGVWIDGDQRTAPDGSSFAWQHWSHTFCYALAATDAGWREADFNARAEDYNHDLTAVVTGAAGTGDGAATLTLDARNVTVTALKPRGNALAAGRPGGLLTDREVTVRLRETDGQPTLVRLRLAAAGGIEAAWRADLLEEPERVPLTVTGGMALVGIGPFATETVVVRVAGSAPQAATGHAPPEPAPPEPAQPVHSRYWLHGKGPAPAGNMPVAVHCAPTRLTLEAGAGGRFELSVACGPEPSSGEVELIVPDGLRAEIDGAAAAPLRYELPSGGFATWDVTVRAAEATAAGRYFIAARIRDALGQRLEDTALVTVGEPGGPDASQPPEELFVRLQSDVQALAAEADLEVLTPALRLAPGQRGELAVRVISQLRSELRGEVQLISPIGTWRATAPWTQAVTVAPGGAETVGFGVTIPATAEPGWQSWLLVKLMYFGRVRYSPAIALTVTEGD